MNEGTTMPWRKLNSNYATLPVARGTTAFRLHAAKNKLINDALFGTDIEHSACLLVDCISQTLEEQKCASNCSKPFAENEWLAIFVFKPILELAQDHPERCGLYETIQILLHKLANLCDARQSATLWFAFLIDICGTGNVILAVFVQLKIIPIHRLPASVFLFGVLLFFAEEKCPISQAPFLALKQCIQTLGSSLKAADVDAIVNTSLLSVLHEAWQVRAGALSTLASLFSSLLLAVECPSPVLASATDFMALSAAIAKRHALYDTSSEVRTAANDLYLVLTSPFPPPSNEAIKGIDADVEAEEKDSPVGNEVVTIHGKASTPVNESQHQAHTPQESTGSTSRSLLCTLAEEPLPDFDDNRTMNDEITQHTDIFCEDMGLDSIFSLESGFPELNSTVDFDVAEFLRGSIQPEAHLADSKLQQQQQVSLKIPGLGISSKHVAILQEAMDAQFGSGCDQGPFAEHDIEAILQHALDLHSAQLYDLYVLEAEKALEQASVAMQGHSQLATALQNKAKAMEAMVHMTVAQDQSRFLDEILPLFADILASPTLLKQIRRV